jgi:hypothetical protein
VSERQEGTPQLFTTWDFPFAQWLDRIASLYLQTDPEDPLSVERYARAVDVLHSVFLHPHLASDVNTVEENYKEILKSNEDRLIQIRQDPSPERRTILENKFTAECLFNAANKTLSQIKDSLARRGLFFTTISSYYTFAEAVETAYFEVTKYVER